MIDVKELGITEDELIGRVVDRLSHLLINQEGGDFEARIEAKVVAKVDEAVEAIAARHVLPNVESYVENLCLQETNQWGEKRGEPVTFREYLVQRAEHYLTEKVDFNGKTQDEDRYNWRGTQTRISHLVHEYLHYEISKAMKEALGNVTSNIAKGLEETVRLKLEEARAALTVNVGMKL